MSKHIASRGQKQGQWVNCPAQQQCTLNSPHAETNELYKVALWKQDETDRKYVPLKDLTLDDYEQYNQIPVGDRDIYTQILADKQQAALNKPRKVRERPATEQELAAINRLHRMGEEQLEERNRKRKLAQQQQKLQKFVKAHYERTEPLEHEETVTPTHVTLKNGTVIKRRSYTANQYTNAVQVSDATIKLAKIWTERPVTEKELDEYINYVKTRKITAFKSLLEPGMATKNSKANPWKREYAEGQLLTTEHIARDIKDGYEIGTTSKYYKSEAVKPAQKNTTVNVPPVETVVQGTEPVTAHKEDVLKLPNLNSIRDFFSRKK